MLFVLGLIIAAILVGGVFNTWRKEEEFWYNAYPWVKKVIVFAAWIFCIAVTILTGMLLHS